MGLGGDHQSIPQDLVLEFVEDELDRVVWYTARASISQQCRIEFLDRFLSKLRLEILPLQAKRLSRERHEHVPGDIFCNWTINGQLQLLGDDESHHLESNLTHEELHMNARCISKYWLSCGTHISLATYFSDGVNPLFQSCFGRLILGMMLRAILLVAAYENINFIKAVSREEIALENNSWTSLSIVLGSIQRWTDSLLGSHRLINVPRLIGKWLTGSKTLPVRRNTRLSEVQLHSHITRRLWTTYFQWNPYWSATNEDCSEIAVAEALIPGLLLHMDSFELHPLRTAHCIIKSWDAWISVVPNDGTDSLTPQVTFQTKLFRSVTI